MCSFVFFEFVFGIKEMNFELMKLHCGRYRSQEMERWGLESPDEIKQSIDPAQPAAPQRSSI